MPKSPVTVPEPLAGDIERSASVDITERESAAEQLSVLLAEAEATGVSDRTLDEILAHIRSGQLRPPADIDLLRRR
ncbi:hypothetical protein GGQ64_000198 [Rhizobium azooxidifex]|uniref:Uncharacterized protein n=1 Tax=Mycoplana azooxidifex TaxID=1636188 RepID=A0A7W6D2T5_9HYPH|nr:hypothetical protein [Mycoplana azooxidifex]MBB3975022.1 hypothetical protein [Mycoplana azooxidifex]